MTDLPVLTLPGKTSKLNFRYTLSLIVVLFFYPHHFYVEVSRKTED